MILSGGPWDGRDVGDVRAPRILVPFVVTQGQLRELSPWVGVVLAVGSITYERGVFQGALATVRCCTSDDHGDHEPWAVDVPVSEWSLPRKSETHQAYRARVHAVSR